MIRVEPASPANLDALLALFTEAGCACFCRYWHFGGTKNEWLARGAFAPDESRAELARDVASGHEHADGLIALDGAVALGWLKLTRLSAVPKLRAQGPYRGLDLGPEEARLAVGCFLVRPELRRGGIALRMLEAAKARARLERRALLGFPHRSAAPLYDEAAFAGPEAAFVGAGFRVLHDSPAYPVYVYEPAPD